MSGQSEKPKQQGPSVLSAASALTSLGGCDSSDDRADDNSDSAGGISLGHLGNDQGEDDDQSFSKATTRAEDDVPMTFPQRLMEILSDESNAEIISWLPHGRGFIIYQKKRFANEVMVKYFKQSKFTSFTRKLNRWGFTRVSRGAETGAYFHPFFQRGNLRLCMQMCCQSAKPSPTVQRNPLMMSSPSALGLNSTMAALQLNPHNLLGNNNLNSLGAPIMGSPTTASPQITDPHFLHLRQLQDQQQKLLMLQSNQNQMAALASQLAGASQQMQHQAPVSPLPSPNFMAQPSQSLHSQLMGHQNPQGQPSSISHPGAVSAALEALQRNNTNDYLTSMLMSQKQNAGVTPTGTESFADSANFQNRLHALMRAQQQQQLQQQQQQQQQQQRGHFDDLSQFGGALATQHMPTEELHQVFQGGAMTSIPSIKQETGAGDPNNLTSSSSSRSSGERPAKRASAA